MRRSEQRGFHPVCCACPSGLRAVSNSAGTYLCNAVHYAQLSWTRPRGVPGVFLHLPPLPGMAAEGAARCARQVDPEAEMDLEMQVRGVLAIARDLLGLEPPL